jgi:hypothetical protein
LIRQNALTILPKSSEIPSTQKREDKNIKAFKGKRRKNEYIFIGVLKMQNKGTWTI